MGLLDRFKRKGTDFETACKKMGTEFVTLYMKEANTSFESITELERQVLAIYFFGMADGLRQHSNIDNDINEVAGTIKGILNDVFKYSREQAKSFFESIVDNLQSKDPQNTQYAIIHRGLNGYFVWNSGDRIDVIKDVSQICGILSR